MLSLVAGKEIDAVDSIFRTEPDCLLGNPGCIFPVSILFFRIDTVEKCNLAAGIVGIWNIGHDANGPARDDGIILYHNPGRTGSGF